MEIKLKLDIQDHEFELTIEEAKELVAVLGGLLNEKPVVWTWPYWEW